MAAAEARLEGDYRAGLSRIGRDGEEVAWVGLLVKLTCTGSGQTDCSFYNGGKREKTILWAAYERLAKHVHTVFKVRIPYGCVGRTLQKVTLTPQNDRRLCYQVLLVGLRVFAHVDPDLVPSGQGGHQGGSRRGPPSSGQPNRK